MESVTEKKALLRKRMLTWRAGLAEGYCLNADRAILKRILEMEAYRQADVIFTYVSMAGEVDTRQLIRRALDDGKKVAVPKCGKRGMMKAYEVKCVEELEPGAYGILEPVTEGGEVLPEDIGLALVPCVGCSESGVRLGYGGGYYDRYLPQAPAFRAVLCREKMMVRSVPKEGHDCAVDFVVTEMRVLEFQRR